MAASHDSNFVASFCISFAFLRRLRGDVREINEAYNLWSRDPATAFRKCQGFPPSRKALPEYPARITRTSQKAIRWRPFAYSNGSKYDIRCLRDLRIAVRARVQTKQKFPLQY